MPLNHNVYLHPVCVACCEPKLCYCLDSSLWIFSKMNHFLRHQLLYMFVILYLLRWKEQKTVQLHVVKYPG